MRTRSDPLTAEQSRLVEENIRLASAVLKKHKTFVKQVGFDEAYSFACLVLCKAVRTFKPEKSLIATHFYYAFSRMCLTYYQDRIAPKERVTSETDQFAGCEDFGLADMLVSRPDSEPGLVDVRDELERRLSFLSYKERAVIELRYGTVDGYQYTLDDVAKVIGVSRSRIGMIQEEALKKLHRLSGAEQWVSPPIIRAFKQQRRMGSSSRPDRSRDQTAVLPSV